MNYNNYSKDNYRVKRFQINEKVPAGDGGISFGQVGYLINKSSY